jgi:exportin-1
LTLTEELNQQFAVFYRAFHQQLLQLLPLQTDIRAAYEGGTEEQQVFVQNLALFYTGFFKVRPGMWWCR